MVIRLGHGSAEFADHPMTIGAYAIKNYVEEKTGGRIRVEVYPAGQLGDTKSLFEMVQMGMLDMTLVPVPMMGAFTDALVGMDMPYLFRGDYELIHRALTGAPGDELLANVEADTGVKAMGFLFHCWRHFFTNKQITSLEDCKGMKLRVMETSIQQAIFQSMGFSPTAIALPDLYQSIQQGTVDGATFDFIGGVSENYYEVCKYVTKSGHIAFSMITTMSAPTFDKLSEEDRQIFQEAAAAAEEATYNAVLELEPVYEQKLAELGVEVIEIDLEPFYAASQSVIDRFCAESPRVKNFVDAVEALRAQ
ncbi:MAG: TRAP transporter substrate-binding protein [Clostridiales bacterium]|nr:TRAP transporter substrate-binding protein [Clostridiales bacterium]